MSEKDVVIDMEEDEEAMLEKMIQAAEDAANEAAAAVMAEEEQDAVSVDSTEEDLNNLPPAAADIAAVKEGSNDITTGQESTEVVDMSDEKKEITEITKEIEKESENEIENVSRKRQRTSGGEDEGGDEEDEEGDKVLDVDEITKADKILADPTSTKRARVENSSASNVTADNDTTTTTATTTTTPTDSISSSLSFQNAGGFADFASGFGGGGFGGSGFGGGGFGGAMSQSAGGFGEPIPTAEGFASFGDTTSMKNDFNSGNFAVFGSNNSDNGDLESGSDCSSGSGSSTAGNSGSRRASPTPSEAGSEVGSFENIAEQHVESPSHASSAAVITQANGEENEINVIDPVRVKVYQMDKKEDDSKNENAENGKDNTDDEKKNVDEIKDSSKDVETSKQQEEENVKWSCLGVGELRLKEMKKGKPNDSPSSNTVPKQRIVMRREYGASTHAGDLKLNLAIQEHMVCEIVQEKFLRITTLGINCVPGAPTETKGSITFLIKVKTVKDAETLGKKIQDHILRCKLG